MGKPNVEDHGVHVLRAKDLHRFLDRSRVKGHVSPQGKRCAESDLHGRFVFDNEQYFSPWGNYPNGVKYSTRTLQEYYDQARLRGREVMQAMSRGTAA